MIATIVGAACPLAFVIAAVILAVLIRREHRSKP